MEALQDILLHQFLILLALGVVFIIVSYWALMILREYMGYGLGLMLGLFFIIVYVSLGGGANNQPSETQYLGVIQVFIATFVGLIFGGLIQIGLRFGMRLAQGVALQVALYTSISIVVLFLVLMEGQIAQRMIGIFALAVAIATLFGMVLFPAPRREQQVQNMSYSQPIAPPQDQYPNQYPPQNLGQGGGVGAQLSRLDEIRQRNRGNTPLGRR
jgi:hypothetical protein